MAGPMAQSATKLTYDDLLLFPDDGKRHELIDGDHYVSPSPNVRHQRVLMRLGFAIYNFVQEHRCGEVFFAPLDIVLSIHDVVEPDLLFVSAERAAIVGKANLRGAPELVAEVLSPSNRRYDEVLKRELYERAGIQEYWLVDPEADTVKVFRRDGERFGRPLLFSRHDSDALTSPLLPGLEIPLDVVLAD
jgi:Uma2 family endonuclease